MPFTIGRLAREARVHVQTVRYYERCGLLPRAPRSRGGYRLYGPDAVARLTFIKRAQELGFSLAEIRELLALRVREASDARCRDVADRTRRKIAVVEQKIRRLEEIRRGLERLVDACAAGRRTGECPLLEVLSESGEPVGV